MAENSEKPLRPEQIEEIEGVNPQQDPSTDPSGTHLMGMAVGAVAGGAAAGAAGGAFAGPAGVAAGAGVGALTGGLAGQGIAEAINPTAEDVYWREQFHQRSYVRPGARYEEYRPAFRYGWEARQQRPDKTFDEIEAELADCWEQNREDCLLAWEDAVAATREAYQGAGSADRQRP
ncbi:hypothetical protein BH23PLA1_BH23PLA1_08940 [soil metagenome]